MKKLISAILIASTISSAYATNCGSVYEDRANTRSIIIMSAAAAPAPLALVSGLGLVYIAGAAATMGVTRIFTGPEIMNQFDHVERAIYASTYNLLDNESFLKVAKKINKVAEKNHNLKMDNQTIAKLIYEADVRMDICPVVKVKKNGKEKRAAMTLKAFANYIADVAATGKTEIKIVNLNEVD